MSSTALICALSSSALFDLTQSHRVFVEEGEKRYRSYQIEHENDTLEPGHAFHLVQKLLSLNQYAKSQVVEVILLSRNSADTGLRIFNSIEHHNLDIKRAAFTRGADPYKYVKAFNAHLFLSVDPNDVREALSLGCAAATILSGPKTNPSRPEVRIAFDGDSVLFSDEAEAVFQQQGLRSFSESEKKLANLPLASGPLKGFLQGLQHLQTHINRQDIIKTALVTARCAPTHERVIKTLRSWDIGIDEALFLGGLSKKAFLEAFEPDFFFDDQPAHCLDVQSTIPTAHVPHGIVNA